MSEKTQNNSKTDAMKTYNYADAVEVAKRYFKGDDLAATVWVSKYALKDSMGNLYEESPEQMHRRIADEIERIERRYPNPMTAAQVYDLLKEFRYLIPQGGPMTGIGNNLQIASLSNCFVIGHRHPADSYGGIIRIDEEQVQLMKRRGGVGHDLSHIRPTGSPVLNSALTSTGIVPFMERYSNSTREVAQDGRRGALMLSLSVKHPDAENFIDAKVETGKVTGANVSIKIDDEFMHAVIDGKKYHQQFPIDSDKPMYEKDIDARALWNKIVFNAWKSAEPGVLFWDTILRESVPDCYADLGFRTVSTNPCGEIPLCPYDSCRLLAINLYSYVDKPFTKEASFNFDKFRRHVAAAMRMMDDIIDLELEKVEAILEKISKDPEDEDIRQVEVKLWEKIREKALQGRRTGLGITAEGDMLAALGLRYGTDEATDFAVEIQKTLAVEAYRTSVKMAQERGKFPIYDAGREEGNPMIERIKEADPALYEEMVKHGRRNIAMLTIAPTGTTSLMSQTTSGIEPVFRPVYTRRRKVNPGDKDVKVTFVDEVGDSWEEYNVFHHKFLVWLEVNGYDIEEVKNMPMTEIDKLVALSPYYKATANDIDWVSKVKMQGAIQKWVDHSISVTVNLPNEVTKELVAKVYLTAWEYGCKGVQDGGSSGQSGRIPAAAQTPARIVRRHRSLQERRGGLDLVRRHLQRPSLRDFHRKDRGGCDVHPAENQKRRDHQGQGRRRQQTLRLPVQGQIRVHEHDRRHLAPVRRRVLELRETDFGRAAQRYADSGRGDFDRIAAPEQREHQYVEKRRGTCAETIHCQWNQSQREVSELRTGNLGLSEQLSGLHELRLLQMRITGSRETGFVTAGESRTVDSPRVLERAFVGRHPETAPFPGLTGKNGKQHTHTYKTRNMIEHKFPESRELDIELNDEIAEGEYSNLVIISHSTSEFVLDFVRMMPGVSKARIKSRIVLAPEHAKRLLLSLQENIERYEAVVGTINLPKMPSEETSMAMSFIGGEA